MRRIAPLLVGLGLLLLARPALAQEAINLRRSVTVKVVADTKDAVVNISATKLVRQRVGPIGSDPFWQHFDFGEAVKVPANSLGSGFVVHPDGYVVTNNHVVDRARQVVVEMADGRKLPATLISADADADLAVLKIESDRPLPALQLGDSSDLLIGEPVIAVGNPLGFSHSVSTGIVSAVHRDLKDAQGRVMLGDLVQTDAAINPGNSGGPLLNAYGQVIGINTAIRGDAQNIGFAVQVNRLRDLIPELMNPAVVSKVDVPVRLAERRGLTPPATVKATVYEAASGEQASSPAPDGARPGAAGAVPAATDGPAVTAINGRPVADIVDAYAALLKVRPSDGHVTLTGPGGIDRQVPVRATPLPDAIVKARERLGMAVEPLTPMLAERYRVQADDGLFVAEIARAGPAARAGLQAGDVVVQLGRYRVQSLADLSALLRHLPETGRVRVGVVRGDRVGFAVVEF